MDEEKEADSEYTNIVGERYKQSELCVVCPHALKHLQFVGVLI